MTSKKRGPCDISIDLAFHGFDDLKNSGNTLLTNSEFWHNYLSSWIAFVRTNDQSRCPSIVKTSSCLSLGLQLTDDESILKINQEWRNKSEPTDVLSFPVIDERSISPPIIDCVELGDIVVSVQTAQKQANENNHSLAKELCWLVSHGFLHLLGWEHATSTSLDEMLNFQEKLLNINGIPQWQTLEVDKIDEI